MYSYEYNLLSLLIDNMIMVSEYYDLTSWQFNTDNWWTAHSLKHVQAASTHKIQYALSANEEIIHAEMCKQLLYYNPGNLWLSTLWEKKYKTLR